MKTTLKELKNIRSNLAYRMSVNRSKQDKQNIYVSDLAEFEKVNEEYWSRVKAS